MTEMDVATHIFWTKVQCDDEDTRICVTVRTNDTLLNTFILILAQHEGFKMHVAAQKMNNMKLKNKTKKPTTKQHKNTQL